MHNFSIHISSLNFYEISYNCYTSCSRVGAYIRLQKIPLKEKTINISLIIVLYVYTSIKKWIKSVLIPLQVISYVFFFFLKTYVWGRISHIYIILNFHNPTKLEYQTTEYWRIVDRLLKNTKVNINRNSLSIDQFLRLRT